MNRLTIDLMRDCADYEVPSTMSRQAYVTRTRSAKTGKLIKRRGKRTIGYRRTNTLKRSWSRAVFMTLTGRDLVGEIKSSGKIAPYNKYVRGEKTQAATMGAKGWLTVKEILDKHWPAAEADFKRILKGKVD